LPVRHAGQMERRKSARRTAADNGNSHDVAFTRLPKQFYVLRPELHRMSSVHHLRKSKFFNSSRKHFQIVGTFVRNGASDLQCGSCRSHLKIRAEFEWPLVDH
jgi:hypothetical protein